jgi:hypothetical protein
MFKLPFPSKKDLDEYYDLIKDRVIAKLQTVSLSPASKAFLSESKIKQIITDLPKELVNHDEEFMEILIPGFDRSELFSYKNLKTKAEKEANPHIIARYSIVNELESVFDYKQFISGSKPFSYQFAQKLARETCTYCNRLYAQTIIVKDPKTNQFNNSGRITRPDFDHWFPKSKFPLLALSYHNLIPCCGVCNSSIKGDTELKLDTHIHPYIHEKDQDFSFNYRVKDVHENNVTITCEKKSKIAATIKEFKIQEVYDAHSGLELKDLLELRYKYSENYLHTLFHTTFKDVTISKQEVYRMIFGVEVDENDFHKRPFSKFKKDILSELGIKL